MAGLGLQNVIKGEIWPWVNLYPLICISIIVYYRNIIGPQIVWTLLEAYKGSDNRNSMYHNRLSDLVHDGFSLDENYTETFEVMNELESAAVYRIRPRWNPKDQLNDWSRVGNESW